MEKLRKHCQEEHGEGPLIYRDLTQGGRLFRDQDAMLPGFQGKVEVSVKSSSNTKNKIILSKSEGEEKPDKLVLFESTVEKFEEKNDTEELVKPLEVKQPKLPSSLPYQAPAHFPYLCLAPNCSFTCSNTRYFSPHCNLQHLDRNPSTISFLDQSTNNTLTIFSVNNAVGQCLLCGAVRCGSDLRRLEQGIRCHLTKQHQEEAKAAATLSQLFTVLQNNSLPKTPVATEKVKMAFATDAETVKMKIDQNNTEVKVNQDQEQEITKGGHDPEQGKEDICQEYPEENNSKHVKNLGAGPGLVKVAKFTPNCNISFSQKGFKGPFQCLR